MGRTAWRRAVPHSAWTLAAVMLIALAGPRLSLAQDDFAFGAFLDGLREQGGPVATVLGDPQRYRVQIIYSQIERDGDGHPTVRSHHYRTGPEYFYPASTVKLPVAVLALEHLARWPGVDAHTPMMTLPAGPTLAGAVVDPTAPRGVPSVGHYVRKIFLVSDNDAYNRLYELLGQDLINSTLHARGYAGVRIVHRLSIPLSVADNRRANAVRFLAPGDGALVAQVPAREAEGAWIDPHLAVPLGVAEMIGGERVPAPKDFASKNALPLSALHEMVQALMLPASVAPERRFRLQPGDLALVRRAMAITPARSAIAAYAQVPDDYVKFLLPSGDGARPELRVFNKVGEAYGFLTDAAYAVDFAHGVEFLLAATVYVNDNGTFNDDQYEYEELGMPFLRALGEAIYAYERRRVRTSPPPAAFEALRALFVD